MAVPRAHFLCGGAATSAFNGGAESSFMSSGAERAPFL